MYYPEVWKQAPIVLLRKPMCDDWSAYKSYRPIILLPVLGKILEKDRTKRETYHCENSWISAHQFEFRPNHSSCDAVLDLIESIKK